MDSFEPGCSQSIMICALPRSGSNLLCEALGSTQRLGNPDEWLNQDRHFWNCGRFGLDPEVKVDGMIRALQNGTKTLNGVFAHKILMYSYTYLMDSLRALEGNAGEPDSVLLQKYFPELRLVYIRRKDRLAQAISLLKASQSEIWHFNERKRGEASPIHFSWTGIQSIHDDLVRQEEAWEKLFRESGIPCIEVLYEDLIGDHAATVNRVIDFLRVECQPYIRDTGRMTHKRTRDNTNREWRQRYEKLTEQMEAGGGCNPDLAAVGHARIETSQEPIEVDAGEVFSQVITVTNTSETRWEEFGCRNGDGWIKLASQIIDGDGNVVTDSASWRELQQPVEPGESFTVEIPLRAPSLAGDYVIWVDLVLTPNQWFQQVSQCGVPVALRVSRSAKQALIEDYLGGARELIPGSLYESDWLGQFHLNEFPRLYHFGLGYLDCQGPGISGDQFVFKSEFYGNLTTNTGEFPEFWSDKHNARLRWHRGTHTPPMLSKLDDGEWVPFNFRKSDGDGSQPEAARDYFGIDLNERGLVEVPWLGLFEVAEFPKVRHELLGVVWCSGPGAKADSYFFFRPNFGWLWTSSEAFPHMLKMDSKEWFLIQDLVQTVF